MFFAKDTRKGRSRFGHLLATTESVANNSVVTIRCSAPNAGVAGWSEWFSSRRPTLFQGVIAHDQWNSHLCFCWPKPSLRGAGGSVSQPPFSIPEQRPCTVTRALPQLQPSDKHTPPEPTSLVPPEILPFALPSSNTERFKTHSSRGRAAA